MTRNYYCDFCQCSFPDNAINRRNHNEGSLHVANRKLHYDWYKEPNLYLQEQLDKSPCRYFLAQGYCEYGLNCKYSHITFDPTSGQTIYPPELIEWFQLQQKEALENQKTVTIKEQKKQRYKLPTGWKVKQLSPSLKPPPSKGYDWTQTGSW